MLNFVDAVEDFINLALVDGYKISMFTFSGICDFDLIEIKNTEII